jgi:hypothetical protein
MTRGYWQPSGKTGAPSATGTLLPTPSGKFARGLKNILPVAIGVLLKNITRIAVSIICKNATVFLHCAELKYNNNCEDSSQNIDTGIFFYLVKIFFLKILKL